MKALLLVAMLLAVPVSVDAFGFPVRVEVDVTVVGTVTLPDREVEIAFDGSLTGTGDASITPPPEFSPISRSVSFFATGSGGVSASGFAGFEDLGLPIVGFVGLTLSTPDWVFDFSEFQVGGPEIFVDPVSRTASFRVSMSPFAEFASVVIGSESGRFTGEASFSGSATAIPEPSVMFLMLASWLLLSTKAVFRRIE